jgi:hypothetical protein
VLERVRSAPHEWRDHGEQVRQHVFLSDVFDGGALPEWTLFGHDATAPPPAGPADDNRPLGHIKCDLDDIIAHVHRLKAQETCWRRHLKRIALCPERAGELARDRPGYFLEESVKSVGGKIALGPSGDRFLFRPVDGLDQTLSDYRDLEHGSGKPF